MSSTTSVKAKRTPKEWAKLIGGIMAVVFLFGLLYNCAGLHDYTGLGHYIPHQNAIAGAESDIRRDLELKLREDGGDETARAISRHPLNQAGNIIAQKYAPQRNAYNDALGMLRDPNQANCKGREVLPGGILKLEVMPSCTVGFETILVDTDRRRAYKVQFESSEGDPIAVSPTFTHGRGSVANYDPQTKTLIAEGDVFYQHRQQDVGKHRILLLTPF